jgi:magnesium transporter
MAETEQTTGAGTAGVAVLTRWEALLDEVRPVAEAAVHDATPEALAAVRTVLEGQHPADVALVMEQLLPTEAAVVFSQLDDERAAEVLDELSAPLSRYLTDRAPRGRIAALLDVLPMDDAAEVIAEATPERQAELLQDLTDIAPDDAAEVRELLSYGEKTAGRLMTDKFLRLSREMTVDQAFAAIRASDPVVETLTDLYVTEPAAAGEERLIGVLSLRHLVRQEPYARIGDVMIPEPITVTVDTDQQEVAQIISKYDFLALPVLDRAGNLAGIVTIDDVIDVLVEEFNEDYLRLVGSDAEEMERRTPAQVAVLRLPWLLGTMLIELFAGAVISRFDWVLKEVILLASFMPVISAISGNVGLQAAAIIVRGLDTGHVSIQNMGRAVRKEFLTSLLMALACGLALGGVGVIWSRRLPFGLVIGGAMTASMLTASLMGTVIPMFSKRLGFDPATSAGPFETAFQDVIGFAVFLWLASLLLPWLK